MLLVVQPVATLAATATLEETPLAVPDGTLKAMTV